VRGLFAVGAGLARHRQTIHELFTFRFDTDLSMRFEVVVVVVGFLWLGKNYYHTAVVVVVGFYWLWLLPYSQVYFGRIQIRILGIFPCTDHAVQDMFEHSGSTKA
jgi:hypothetical protein